MLLRSALEVLPLQIAILDAAGIIVEANATWRADHAPGLPADAGPDVGANLLRSLEGVSGDARGAALKVAAGIRSVLRGQRLHFVDELPLAGTHRARWRRIHVSPVSSTAFQGCVVCISDISEQKQTEYKLQSQERDLAEVERIAHLGSWSLDLRTGRLTWSDETYRIFGVPTERFPRNYEDLVARIHPDDRTRFETVRSAALTSGSPFHSEHRIIRPDGEIRIVRERGELIRDRRGRAMRFSGTTLDITELRKADEALRQSERRFRTLIENSLNVIYLKDPAGRFILTNREFESLFGAAKGSLLGKTDYEIMPPEYAEHLRRNDQTVFDTGRPLRVEESIVRDNEERVYLSMKFPLVGENGSVYGLGGVSTDITEIKRSEQTLRESEEALRALTARLESIREEERLSISREVHDELGQILTALKMDQSLLAESLKSTENAPPPREEIGRELASIGRLADRAMEAVRRIAAELRPEFLGSMDLGEAVKRQTLELAQRSGLQVTATTSGELDTVPRDVAAAVFRILQEGITNVIRHAEATRVEVRLEKQKERVELTVMDNGKGICPSRLTGQRSLGLLGIRERAATLGGTVTINGQRGHGTVVHVCIPAGSALPEPLE